MSAGKVDVLSVMRYLHDLANESPAFNKADRQESHAAREAVAELIEAANVGIVFADRRKAVDNADTITPAQARVLIVRLRAALARVQP